MVSFTKMQGTGNDFIVLDNRAYQFSEGELSACAAEWCRRHYGIGADGLLALDSPETSTADYRMQYLNADGTYATMCGNGARCLFRFAQQAGFTTDELAFETDAGLYRAAWEDREHDLVRLFAPDITDLRSEVSPDRAVPEAIRSLHFAHAGTEHLVARVDDVETVPVCDWGAHLRHDPAFAPTGTNVNFVEVGEEGTVHLRTYEKGVEDETLSCGTGVLAAAVVVEDRRGGASSSPVTVQTHGGILRVGVETTERGPQRYLEGPAISVFQGTVQVPSALKAVGENPSTTGAPTDCP